MKFLISVEKSALRRLKAHINYREQFSETVPKRILKEYEETIELLKENPYMFRRFESEILNGEFRYKVLDKRYRLVFEIIENRVIVRDIQDCRQDTDKNLI